MAYRTLVEILAREHRTVERLVEELAALDAADLDGDAELLGLLQSYTQRSKASLVAVLSENR